MIEVIVLCMLVAPPLLVLVFMTVLLISMFRRLRP